MIIRFCQVSRIRAVQKKSLSRMLKIRPTKLIPDICLICWFSRSCCSFVSTFLFIYYYSSGSLSMETVSVQHLRFTRTGKNYDSVLSIQLFGVFAPSENCNCLNQVNHHPHSRRKAFQICQWGGKSDINIQLESSHSLFGWSSQMIWHNVEQWLLKNHLDASSFARGIEVQMYWTANMARQCHCL